MAVRKNPAAEISSEDLVLTRVLDVPARVVFDAWTRGEQLAKWWGPKRFTNPRCEIEPRAGGRIRIDMRAPDGTTYPMRGEVEKIAEPELLVFRSEALDARGEPVLAAHNVVTFEDRGNRTTLTVRARVTHATAEAAAFVEGMEIGWKESLDRLGAFLRRSPAARSARRDEAERASGGVAGSAGAAGAAGSASSATAAAASAANGATSNREIVLSQVVEARRELVWDAMTHPEHVVRWWGPEGFTTTTQEMDVRPGGHWKHVMHGPDGKHYPNLSIFREVVRPQRIAFSHGGGEPGEEGAHFDASWTFEEEGPDRTKVTVRMVFPTAADRDRIIEQYGAVEGGRQTLARLAEHVTKMAAAGRRGS